MEAIWLLPQVNEVWGKVMFLHLCVILFTGRGISVQGVSVQGGLCQGDSPPYGKVWAVRILLECFLVL